jgi:hypothetical protein
LHIVSHAESERELAVGAQVRELPGHHVNDSSDLDVPVQGRLTLVVLRDDEPFDIPGRPLDVGVAVVAIGGPAETVFVRIDATIRIGTVDQAVAVDPVVADHLVTEGARQSRATEADIPFHIGNDNLERTVGTRPGGKRDRTGSTDDVGGNEKHARGHKASGVLHT